MSTVLRLEILFKEILSEAKRNQQFAERIEEAFRFEIEPGRTETQKTKNRLGRRALGTIDPFGLYQEGEDILRTRLGELNLEQLKDIIAEHGMDTMKLAMKWKTSERLAELIVSTVASRSRKGNAFRT